MFTTSNFTKLSLKLSHFRNFSEPFSPAAGGLAFRTSYPAASGVGGGGAAWFYGVDRASKFRAISYFSGNFAQQLYFM